MPSHRYALVRLAQLLKETPLVGDAMAQQAVQMLTRELLDGILLILPEYSCHDASSIVCAMATLNAFDGPLVSAISAKVLLGVDNLTSFNVAGLLWAFSRYALQKTKCSLLLFFNKV